MAALERAVSEAESALQAQELEIADSRYRSALLEGWLLLGALELQKGDLQGAKRAFERSSTAAVETRRPLMSLALVLLQLGEAEPATFLMRRVVGGQPTDFEARRLLARALVATGQLDEAIQELEELRVLTPENLENTYLLATAYLSQGNPEKADALLLELADKRPLPRTQILVGRTYRDFGLYDRARLALETALEMDPSVPRAHYYLGTVEVLEHGQARLQEAMQQFTAELRVAPEDPMTNLYLGMALVEERRHAEALPRLEIASRAASTQRDALQFLGRSYLAMGRASEAVTTLRRAIDLAEIVPKMTGAGDLLDRRQSQLSSLHYQLAQALRRIGDEETAAKHFEAARKSSAKLAESSRESLRRYLDNETRERGPGSFTSPLDAAAAGLGAADRLDLERSLTRSLAQTYLNLGVLQVRAERFSRATDLFEQAAELDPDSPQVQYSLGVACFNDGQYERATEPLSRALEASPEDANLRRMLALAWLNSQHYGEAAELLRDDPQRLANPSLQYAYGVALVRSGREAQAATIFADLLSGNADWPELNVVLGQAHAGQDDYEAAIRYLERAIELQPDIAEAHATLGDIYLRQGKLAEAEEALLTELRLHPADTRAQYTLAVVLDLHRKPEEALDVLRALLEVEPQHADGRYLMGKILLARGALEEALEQLSAAVRLSPGDANIHYQLGQAYQRLGRAEEARQAFESFRQLKKDGTAGDQP